MAQVNKYNHSKIYKICSNLTDKIYIGSTTQSLSQRLSDHIRHYNQYVRNNERYITSYEIIKLGDYYITLIEENNFNNRQQLFKREGEIIKLNINNVVNNRIAGRTDTEYYIDNKTYIAEQNKQYRQDNKEHIAEQTKQYRQDNKEHIAEHKKQYSQDNKEHRLEHNKIPFNCILCGVTITLNGKSKHMRTTKHINLINQQLFNNELNHYNF